RVFVHDAADAVADILRYDAKTRLLHEALHDHGDFRPPAFAAHLDGGDLECLLGDLHEPPPFRPNIADGDGDGPIGTPAVELAGGVDLDEVALTQGPRAGDAMHDLIVDRDTGRGGKRHFGAGRS